MDKSTLDEIARQLKLFLEMFEKMHGVKVGGTSCCGCSDITLEVMPENDRSCCVDVMELGT